MAAMMIRAAVAALVLAVPHSTIAEVTLVRDPDVWIRFELNQLVRGKTDEFARKIANITDTSDSYDKLAEGLRSIREKKPLTYIEKIVDTKYETALRQIVYIALFGKTDYAYFMFTSKRSKSGWLISDFKMRGELGELFPKDFYVQRP